MQTQETMQRAKAFAEKVRTNTLGSMPRVIGYRVDIDLRGERPVWGHAVAHVIPRDGSIGLVIWRDDFAQMSKTQASGLNRAAFITRFDGTPYAHAVYAVSGYGPTADPQAIFLSRVMFGVEGPGMAYPLGLSPIPALDPWHADTLGMSGRDLVTSLAR